jgi:ubiquinone/menaquinone biosynthesis C-methylase UbiE
MTRDAWDRAYADGMHRHQWDTPWSSPELAGFLAGLVELPERAIDLGCGTGADVVFLAQQGIDAVGLDISPKALELARTRADDAGVTATWVEGDVLDLPFADAEFDLVVDRGCLHHVPDADQPRYAAEVARVLRPGGVLLIREMNEAGRHKHAVTEASIRAMLLGTELGVRSIVAFDMVGAHGTARATMSVIARQSTGHTSSRSSGTSGK